MRFSSGQDTCRALSFDAKIENKSERKNAMTEQGCSKVITIERSKRGGKPCIRSMRITVYDVLEYLASGMTYQEILDDFPYLTQQDILACLSFAAKREQFMLVVGS